MTTLIERCQAVDLQFEQLDLARMNANVRKLVQERTREWAERYAKLKAARERAAWLALSEEDLPVASERRVQLQHNAQESLARLTSGADVSTLTEDAMWTRLLQSAEGAANALNDGTQAAWRSFIDAQGGLVAPHDLRDQVSATPTNERVIAAYRALYAGYSKLDGQALPRGAEDKDLLLQTIQACRLELSKVEHNVPSDVEEFFRAVFSNSATLASLTPGVLKWLGENGHLERYMIRSATQ